MIARTPAKRYGPIAAADLLWREFRFQVETFNFDFCSSSTNGHRAPKNVLAMYCNASPRTVRAGHLNVCKFKVRISKNILLKILFILV